jgi:hypothetical protein
MNKHYALELVPTLLYLTAILWSIVPHIKPERMNEMLGCDDPELVTTDRGISLGSGMPPSVILWMSVTCQFNEACGYPTFESQLSTLRLLIRIPDRSSSSARSNCHNFDSPPTAPLLC